jgi:hypothetical protein
MSARSVGEYSVRDARGERPPHILVIGYLFPPCDAINVRRPAALRNAFDSLGVRTTVLTSAISGRLPDDDLRGVIRAGDLRTRFETPYQTLVGYNEAQIQVRTKPRWWTRFIVPDVSTVSWMPAALPHLLRLLLKDRPDGVLTTSPPESAHLLGAVARRARVPWIADFRDGWIFDPPNPRPALTRLDKRLERAVVRSADVVTAINEPIAEDFRQRFGVGAVHVSNGFDSAALATATDERETVDRRRFSIVYTGTLGVDATELHDRGGGARAFLGALVSALSQREELRTRIELVVAGVTTSVERDMLTRGPLRDVVRVLGRVPHSRALGLQRAAGGLLLVAGSGEATTGKAFEYLSAEKPIFAIARVDGPAARLLGAAGEHTIAPSGDEQQIEQALIDYLDRWMSRGESYRPNASFDIGAYDFDQVARKMLDLFAEAGALSRSDRSPTVARTAAS